MTIFHKLEFSSPTSGYIQKGSENRIISALIASLFTIVKIWKQFKCPSTNELGGGGDFFHKSPQCML